MTAMINGVSFAVFFIFMCGLLKSYGDKTSITIGNLVTWDTEGPTTKGFKLALDVAKNSLEFNDFFGKYDIELFTLNTHKNPDNAVVYADRVLMYEKKALLILGPNTLTEATSVLHVVGYYKKLMVTYIRTTQEVFDDPFGITFAQIPESFNEAKIKLVEYFNWTRVAVVYDFSTYAGLYLKVVNHLSLRKKKFDIVAYEAINSQLTTNDNKLHDSLQGQLKKLKDQDLKIFLGEFGPVAATLIFCELYRIGMYGPEYVWILNPDADNIDEWVRLANLQAQKNQLGVPTCTREQFEVVVNRTFLLAKTGLRRDDNTKTDSGLTLKEFIEKINTKTTNKEIAALSFDVMWAVLTAFKSTYKEYPLENHTKELTENLEKQLQNLSFEGLTGPMSFDAGKVIQRTTILQQYQDGGKKLVDVGRHQSRNSEGGFINFFIGSEKTLWKDNRVPSDHTEIKTKMSDIPDYLFVVFSAAASFGIVMGIVFLVFNRYYRKFKFIKLSAPLFNDITVLGCIACLATVFLFGMRVFEDPKKTFPLVCKTRAWILNIGFSLAFGAMFIKTWRIYKIFTNKRLKVRLGPLSDWLMLAMVGGIVLIDVVTLLAWELADPLQHNQTTIRTERNPNNPFEIIEHKLNICKATKLPLWLTLIFVYKGILLLYGLFLAYETRNVVYAHLNDSRVIGICVYNVVFLSTIGAFLSVILDDTQYKELYAVLSLCIIFPATTTISLIFLPKLVHRLKADSLDDETGETTMRESIDIPTIVTFQGTDIGKEKFIDSSPTNTDGSFTNTLCVSQNGGSSGNVSLTPLPIQPANPKDIPCKPLED
ncbi:gamma-aminobutyric acid type B receptor subunit 1-like [Montipora capricornis]|uniref:gamma-aminobutyric acid type B receptor subunit 1-like n=1 Tax=Montipora capricornis TaxID=246305 RepID=UPI0035F125CC